MSKRYKVIKEFPNPNREYPVGTIISNKGFGDMLKLAPKWPEYFEEIKEYEILEFIKNGCITSFSKTFDINLLNNYLELGNEIHKIKRISDGEIFSVGDKLDKDTKIKAIKVYPDGLWMDFEGCNRSNSCFGGIQDISEWIKYKEPILITEDGVELNYPDKYVFVDVRSWNYGFDNVEKNKNYIDSTFKRFAKRKNAEKYIEENKPQYSKKQIMDIIGRDGDEFTDRECVEDLYDLVNKGEIKTIR